MQRYDQERYTSSKLNIDLFNPIILNTLKAPLMVPLMSRRGDSNARPPRPERGALPTALLLAFVII